MNDLITFFFHENKIGLKKNPYDENEPACSIDLYQ